MSNLPTGTVTFLFTDIEGSTQRWEQYPVAMKAGLAQHDTLVRAAFAAHGGIIFQTAGDSFLGAFPTAPAALAAALQAERALLTASWPVEIGAIRARAALHSGPAELRADGYHAEVTLNRLARLLAAGSGGQILCTDTTHALLAGRDPAQWLDLGEHWLKDLIRPLHVYQVLAPDLPQDFPPLKSLPGPGSTPASADASSVADNPYKGLRAFQEADAPDFFGREALTERLVARLGEAVPLARFLAVVGPSGSGKSSVVRAGVLPALRRGGLPGSEQWIIVELIPGPDPLRELAAALGAATGQDPAPLLPALAADEYGLLHVAQQLAGKATQPGGDERPVEALAPPQRGEGRVRGDSQLLLVIDQFEEVFTLVADEPARVHLLESLHRAVTAPDTPVHVIVTLRADFYDRPLLYPDPGELVRWRTEVVLPLTPEELARAINGPAERAGVAAEPALVGAMIQDVAEQPGTLPLLEYALTELFDRRAGNRLNPAAYRAGGGVQGALGRRAEEIYAGLSPAAQTVAQQLFLRLVTPGEGTEDTRRRVRRAELAGLPVDADTLDGVLEAFSRYRLLTFDRDPATREPTVEVAHEALIRAWGRLREWLEASRADLRVQRQLQATAAGWAAGGQDASFLASGTRLGQFTDLATGGTLALTGEERAYLAASAAEQARQAVAERERQAHELELARQAAQAQRSAAQRLRGLVGALAIFLVIAAGLAAFAFAQQSEAASQRLVAQNNAATAVANGAAADAQRATAVANGGVADAQRATAVANGAEANAQRATAVANGAAAESARGTAVADLAQSEAQRLAADANNVMQTGGQAELAGLLSLRSIQTAWSPQGDAALEAAARLDLPIRRFVGHADGVGLTAFSPDGKILLTEDDKTTRLWDVASGRQVADLGDFGGDTISFSPDSKHILGTHDDGTMYIWDTVAMTYTQSPITHTAALWWAVYSPDGHDILTSSSSSTDRTAQVWDAATGRQLQIFHADTPFSPGLAWSPDGQFVLTGGSDSLARLWDLRTGQQVRSFDNGSEASPTHGILVAAYSPDGKMIATCGGASDAEIWIWDVATGARVQQLVGGNRVWIDHLAFGPDSQTLLASSNDSLRLWDVRTGRVLKDLRGPNSQVDSSALAPDGRHAVAGYDDGTVVSWDLTAQPELPIFRGHTGPVWSAAFSPDDRTVLTGSDDGTARLWDAATGRPLQPVIHSVNSSTITWAAFSPDGKDVVTAGGKKDKAAHIWDLATGAEVQSFYGHTKLLVRAIYSPDGKTVLTAAGDLTARLWDVATGLPTRVITADTVFYVEGAAFSPDGKTVLTGGDGKVARLWDVATGTQIRQFTRHTDVIFDTTFAPDGKRVLTGSADGTARLWDVQTGTLLGTVSAHGSPVHAVAFSPDGRSILTGSQDFVAHLWDISGCPGAANCGQELRSFAGHTGEVLSVTFSHDGQRVLTSSGDGTARVWHTAYQDTVRYLCGRLIRDLTPDERTQYGIPDPGPTCPGR